MTRPFAASKVLLLPDRRVESPEPGGATIRRYRIARLRFDSPPAGAGARFEHLKRTFD